MRYILNGDLTKTVRVIAEGATESEAIKNAEHGVFTIYEEVNKDMMFVFDGNSDGICQHPSETETPKGKRR